MTQENKELLLKDLCGRIPYGVTIQGINPDGEIVVEKLSTISSCFDCNMAELHSIKPYLFPLSSMTEEQREEWKSLMIKDPFGILYYTVESYDYLYKNHIDIRGLIPMELAVDATGLNIY